MSKFGVAYALACLLFVAACVSEPGTGFWGNIFDGMTRPDPAAARKDPYRLEVKRIKRDSTEPQVFMHEPFGKGACKDCHSRKVAGLSPKGVRKLCTSCHEGFFDKLEFAHGPVVAGSCLECHHHHWSKIKGILRRKPQDICLSCHGTTDLSQGDCGWRDESASSCIDCHGPHGGSHPFFLRRRKEKEE